MRSYISLSTRFSCGPGNGYIGYAFGVTAGMEKKVRALMPMVGPLRNSTRPQRSSWPPCPGKTEKRRECNKERQNRHARPLGFVAADDDEAATQIKQPKTLS